MNQVYNKVIFYIENSEGSFKTVFQDEIKKLRELGVLVSFHESRVEKLPEACINGYCVAGVDDIKYELNSLIPS